MEPMAETRNARGNEERIEGTFPIRETNGVTKIKNISPSTLPHFHGLTTKDPDNFLFEFAVICRTYDYAETKEIKAEIEEKVAEFLRENIFYKFGYLRELVIDQGSQFTSNLIENLLTHHKIKHKTSTPYHPQVNGQVEVNNRALEGILTKVVSNSRKDWVDRLVEATWAYNTTSKTTTGFTPYELVFGKKALRFLLH